MDEITKIRKKIDMIDNKIIKLLESRKKEVVKIRRLKKANSRPPVDKVREKEIMSKMKDSYQQAIFKKILHESRKIQLEP